LLAAEGPVLAHRRPAGNGLRRGHPALALGFGQAPAPGLGAGRGSVLKVLQKAAGHGKPLG
jgi:hypothetical protein